MWRFIVSLILWNNEFQVTFYILFDTTQARRLYGSRRRPSPFRPMNLIFGLAFPNLKYSYLVWIFKRAAVYIHGVPISNICIYLFWIRNFLSARFCGVIDMRHVCLFNSESNSLLYLFSQIFNFNIMECSSTLSMWNLFLLSQCLYEWRFLWWHIGTFRVCRCGEGALLVQNR